MKKIAFSFFLLFIFSQINFSYAEEPARLCLAGCKTEYFLVKQLANAFEKKANVRFRILSVGNKRAVGLMMSKKADCTFTCKSINLLSKKLGMDSERIAGWKSVPIAKDSIILVAHSDNGIDDISRIQLTSVFQGKIESWKELGGNDLPVRLAYIDPAVESGMLMLFKEYTVGANGQLSRDARLVGSPVGLGAYISNTPGGITFIPFNAYQKSSGRVIKVDGVRPGKENIVNGKYKMSTTYYLTYVPGKNVLISKFVDFCLSDQGRKIVSNDFIPYNDNSS